MGTTRCLWRPLGAGELRIFPSCVLGAPPRMATLETCQLVVTWQHCWHGNNVEEFKLCMDYGQSIYGNLAALHYCKKMTRVYLLGTRTNSFCICCSIYQKTTNLTMLFNVLLTTFTFISFFSFFFLMTSGHASNNPFQVVYFCFPIK